MSARPRPVLRGPLSVLRDDEVDRLLSLAIERRYDRGSVLMHQGDAGQDIHVLVSGRVRVVVGTTDGEEILVALRGPGDVLGELAVLDPAPRTATVSALEDVDALIVRGPDFLRFLRDHAHVTFSMLQLVVRRLRESDRRLVDGRAEDTVTRLARHLLELAARYGAPADDGLLLDVPLSQEQLASWVGASREAVNAALGDLRERGTLATGRMRITLLDVETLRETALGVDGGD